VEGPYSVVDRDASWRASGWGYGYRGSVMAHEEWINDALQAERLRSGSEWPDSMKVARTVLDSYSTGRV